MSLEHPSAAPSTGNLEVAFDSIYDDHTNTALSPTSSDATLDGGASTASLKRKDSPVSAGRKPVKKPKKSGTAAEGKGNVMSNTEAGDKDGESSASKPKRVRTGCLTCRERHLKCDEGIPDCNNCKKSNRVCKRGLKLNFIDTWAEQPPVTMSTYGTREWKVEFMDESRDIAGEYEGGTQKYKPLIQGVQNLMSADHNMAFDHMPRMPPAPNMSHQPLPSMQGSIPDSFSDPGQPHSIFDADIKSQISGHQQAPANSSAPSRANYSGVSSHSSLAPGSVGSYGGGQTELIQSTTGERREYLDNQEETLFMQVFVEEVGLWMDSMDPQKHFSRLLPFHSLSEPMLLNAFLACGAKHLTLVNPIYSEEKALNYYDTATRYLLKNLQDPNRDTVICATTAVILNVYEIMSERALQRMNHIAGARALIKECGWNARTRGVGSACFWLNVGLEVLSCLHFNWQSSWSPDDWGVDMDFSRELENGREEIWTHRMLYIIAKVSNFRATIPSLQSNHLRMEQAYIQQRLEEWTRLKKMADAWNDGIPRTMHPMAYLHPYQTSSRSAFPEVWLVKRSTIVARLFYHTAQLLLAQIHPYFGADNAEMSEMQMRHAQQICGITAHVKDRGVASVAIRSLAHAAEVLTKRHEQEEVLQIFEKINKETGWRVGYVYGELKEKWGWSEGPSPEQFAQTHLAAIQQKEAQNAQRYLQEQAKAAQSMQQGYDFTRQSMNQPIPQHNVPPPSSVQHTSSVASHSSGGGGGESRGGGGGGGGGAKKIPQGIPNPMYAMADFNLPKHPYQNFYVAPNHITSSWNFGDGGHMYYNI